MVPEPVGKVNTNIFITLMTQLLIKDAVENSLQIIKSYLK